MLMLILQEIRNFNGLVMEGEVQHVTAIVSSSLQVVSLLSTPCCVTPPSDPARLTLHDE